MGGLVVVAIELMSGGYAMLLHEANAAHRVGMSNCSYVVTISVRI